MRMRSLRFVLLVWLVGVLHAQTSTRFCRPPSLNRGYFLPDRSIFHHDSRITYACDAGHKPTAEGWWATTTCEDGKWSPEPRCIDENACLPLSIPNAEYAENSNGWYEQGSEITITCNKEYEHNGQDSSARCVAGSWIPVPVCEESSNNCGEPPKVLHAVIINEEHQDVYAANSRVQYECEDGHTTEDGNTKKTISCVAGKWSTGPTCSPRTNSGSNKPAPERHFTTIDRCGEIPVVANGVVVQTEHSYFKYKCVSYYKQVGSDTVRCHGDGSWSQVPTCRASYCSVNTGEYPELINVGTRFLQDGEKVRLECVTSSWQLSKYSDFMCTDGRMKSTKCCTSYSHQWGYC
ncbi:unnamed protein product [Ophioblennius macclurei]